MSESSEQPPAHVAQQSARHQPNHAAEHVAEQAAQSQRSSTSKNKHAAENPAANPPARRTVDRRQSVVDRRLTPTGLERRRGPGRRRTDFVKSAEEGEMSQEQFLFLKAIDAYKRVNNRPYPTWSEVLEVIRKLGYRKTAPMTVQLPAVEDWTEAPDAPAFSEERGEDENRADQP